MSQNQVLKQYMPYQMPQTLFPLNLRNVNQLFPGFAEGDFAVIEGSSSVASLTSLLCVRAQLVKQLGGLNSCVVFIDGGNSFRLYQITRLAQLHQLNPRQVLDNIYISRAFTAHQLTTLIMQKLKPAVQQFGAKIAIISNLTEFFSDNDLAEPEAQRVFSQVTTYLSNFARENQIILIATNPPYQNTKRNNCLQSLMHQKAGVVLSLGQTAHARTVSLEKHPYLKLGSIELPAQNVTLTDYMGESA
jgi:RecA/RadA recombinase